MFLTQCLLRTPFHTLVASHSSLTSTAVLTFKLKSFQNQEGTARYVGLLLAPVEGFDFQQSKLLALYAKNNPAVAPDVKPTVPATKKY